jgi:uncharacterized protein DUF2442
MLYEIAKAEAHSDHTVTVIWSDGMQGVVNLGPYIAKGGVFAPLEDPAFFVQEMRILRGGIGLTWPNEVDFSADGLRHDAFMSEESSEGTKSQDAQSSD